MYLYIKNWCIIYKSKELKKTFGFLKDCKIEEYQGDSVDNLIYEDGKIKKYENSNQFIKDTNRYYTEKELRRTKQKNQELMTIANSKVKKDLELEKKGQEPSEYQRKIYLLKNMRWLQQS